jgi:ankyrin repeat protein
MRKGVKDIERIIVSNERIFPNEMNALEYAIHHGKYGSAEALINRKKVNINQIDPNGNTPFMRCISSNSYEAFELALKLLEKK